MIEVFPSIRLSTGLIEQAGVDVKETFLHGRVVDVGDQVREVRTGDEVLFLRPEGHLPELAIVTEDILLSKVIRG